MGHVLEEGKEKKTFQKIKDKTSLAGFYLYTTNKMDFVKIVFTFHQHEERLTLLTQVIKK